MYTTKKELRDATGVDTSNLAAKRGFISLKADVGKETLIYWLMF